MEEVDESNRRGGCAWSWASATRERGMRPPGTTSDSGWWTGWPRISPSISAARSSARCSAAGRIEGLDVVLAKPMAFMNRSGPPVRAWQIFFGFQAGTWWSFTTTSTWTYGRFKIKEKGGHGGHNGVRSLIDAFGGGDFARLRVGIGRSETAGQPVADYVLDQFTRDEAAALPGSSSGRRDAVVTILCKGTKIGMNQFNTKPVTRTD